MVRVEIKSQVCPVSSCIYISPSGKCRHKELSEESVDAEKIAEIKELKPYIVKAKITAARERIKIGILSQHFADYIKDNKLQSVNKVEDTNYDSVLLDVLRLPKEYHNTFLDIKTFNSWKLRQKIEISMSDVLNTLLTLQKDYHEFKN
jgi:hypothetical protein